MNTVLSILGQTEDIKIVTVIILLFISFFEGLVISKIYLLTHEGFSFDKSFPFTLILITIIISLIMLVISKNIALSLGLIGSLSIIRFRTVVKDSRDMAFLFWSIAIGLIIGAQYYFASFVALFFIALVIFLLKKYNINKTTNSDYILVISSENEMVDNSKFQSIFDDYRINWILKSSFKDNENLNNEISYSLSFNKLGSNNIAEVQEKIVSIKGIKKVDILGPETNIYA